MCGYGRVGSTVANELRESGRGTSVGKLLDRGIFTLAIVRGPGEYDANPPAERKLQAGEELILSASRDTLRSLPGGKPAPGAT